MRWFALVLALSLAPQPCLSALRASSTVGIKGPAGPVGPAGPAGAPGAQGPQGVAGQTGAAGATGAKGDTGAAGAQGSTGAAGPQGAAGATGAQGPAGAAGATGLAGAAGANATDAQVLSAVSTYLAAHPVITDLGTITVSQTAAVTIAAGIRSVSASLSGVAAGDKLIFATPSGVASGYAIENVVAASANTVSVTVNGPLLAINASYSIQVRIMRVN